MLLDFEADLGVEVALPYLDRSRGEYAFASYFCEKRLELLLLRGVLLLYFFLILTFDSLSIAPLVYCFAFFLRSDELALVRDEYLVGEVLTRFPPRDEYSERILSILLT